MTLRECPVCESEAARELLFHQSFDHGGPVGTGYDVVACLNCGAGFADHIAGQDVFDQYYKAQSKYEFRQTGGLESAYDRRRFERIADEIEEVLPDKKSRILDVGCATGGLLAVLHQRGYRFLLGVDPSAACCEAAHRVHNIDAKCVTLLQLKELKTEFDCVIMVGVLEHVRNLRDSIAVARDILSPSGVLYTAQPDVTAFSTTLKVPFQQFSMEHINFFSPLSLIRCMLECNLKEMRSWRWLTEWREGISDSVLSAAFERCTVAGSLVHDDQTAPALRKYIECSAGLEVDVVRRIDHLVGSQRPVIVWGAGTSVRRLLTTTNLARANIIAFVDANPHIQEAQLAGRAVLAPEELRAYDCAVVLGSAIYEYEILTNMREQLGVTNPVLRLF